MQISLNQLVEQLADMVKRPFDIPLQEELKQILNYKRADYIQQIVGKYPENRRFYLRYITDDLIEVDKAECPAPSTNCTVLRTSNKIPVPVRSSYELFSYVGDTDKTDGYSYIEPHQLLWIVNYASKYTKDRPKYAYFNGYVYIFNEDYLNNITIGAVWADPKELNTFKCDDQPCYSDDDRFEIPDDIVNTMIQDVLKNELKFMLGLDETEVTIDNKDGAK